MRIGHAPLRQQSALRSQTDGQAVDPHSSSTIKAMDGTRRKRAAFYFSAAIFTLAAVWPSSFILTTTRLPTVTSENFAG